MNIMPFATQNDARRIVAEADVQASQSGRVTVLRRNLDVHSAGGRGGS